MATTGTPFLTVGVEFDRLQPSRPFPKAEWMHGKLKPSTTYPMGQVVFYDGVNDYWDKAVAGTLATGAGPRQRILHYPWITDAQGHAYMGNTIVVGDSSFESVPMYVSGAFFVKDLVGIGADNELAQLGHLSQGAAWNDADPLAEVTLKG
jgi:hypothetical protein